MINFMFVVNWLHWICNERLVIRSRQRRSAGESSSFCSFSYSCICCCTTNQCIAYNIVSSIWSSVFWIFWFIFSCFIFIKFIIYLVSDWSHFRQFEAHWKNSQGRPTWIQNYRLAGLLLLFEWLCELRMLWYVLITYLRKNFLPLSCIWWNLIEVPMNVFEIYRNFSKCQIFWKYLKL